MLIVNVLTSLGVQLTSRPQFKIVKQSVNFVSPMEHSVPTLKSVMNTLLKLNVHLIRVFLETSNVNGIMTHAETLIVMRLIQL